MEGFTYTNIFDTKGIEYLIIIAFLLLIIPFWYILNGRKTSAVPVRKQFSLFNVKVPMGVFLSRNHMWAYLEKNGLARTGIDDFLFRVAGKLELNALCREGDIVKQGDLIAEASRNGRKLRIFSPVSGKISEVNENLNEDRLAADPYGAGWIYRVVPSNWKKETQSFMLAEETGKWLNGELAKFRDMAAGLVAGTPATVLQDGGEIAGHPLAEMTDEAWSLFEKSFLTLEAGNE